MSIPYSNPCYEREYFFERYNQQYHPVVNNLSNFMAQTDFYNGWHNDGTYLSSQFAVNNNRWQEFSMKIDHCSESCWLEPSMNAPLSTYVQNILQSKSDDRNTLACSVCNKQYNQKNCQLNHFKQHVCMKPFNCQVCGKRFSQTANLRAHKRVHTGEKPFSCPICQRLFSQSSSLATHKRTHTGEKPYPCVHCGKAFTDSSTRAKHLRTHTGQKPYQCHICLMRFTQSGNLHRHLRTHRNESPTTAFPINCIH